MSIDWLEDLSRAVDNGKEVYLTPGIQSNEWHMAFVLEELRSKGQRTANSRKFQSHIYRLINRMDTVSDDSYVVVRKILDPSPQGDPRFQWAIVDTREAAELLRDVSQGPTPYFGATIVETFEAQG